MKYVLYKIGVDSSYLDETDVYDSFSIDQLRSLPERHRAHIIQLLRSTALLLESETYHKH